MSFETMRLLESVNASPPGGEGVTIQEIFARAAAARDPGEVSERAGAEAKRAAALDQAEALAIGNRAAGDPLGEVQRAQVAAAEIRGDVADLEARLERKRAQLARAESTTEFWAQRSAAVYDCAQRSAAPSGDPLEMASRRAHQAFVEATRARWETAQSGTARRPFGSASRGGVAVRAERVTCKGCIAAGASPEESFLLHADPSPAPVPDGWVPPQEYCRDCYGELPGECKCSKVAGRYQPVNAGGRTHFYDKQYGEMIYR